MKLGRRVLVLVSVHKVRRRAVILHYRRSSARMSISSFLVCRSLTAAQILSRQLLILSGSSLPVRVETLKAVISLVCPRRFHCLQMSEDTVVVVSIGNRDNLHRRIFLYIHDISLVITVSVRNAVHCIYEYNTIKVRRHIVALPLSRRTAGIMIPLYTIPMFASSSLPARTA